MFSKQKMIGQRTATSLVKSTITTYATVLLSAEPEDVHFGERGRQSFRQPKRFYRSSSKQASTDLKQEAPLSSVEEEISRLEVADLGLPVNILVCSGVEVSLNRINP